MGKVIKRNGMCVPFDKAKVRNAISLANDDVSKENPKSCIDKETIDLISNRIYNRCRQRVTDTSVEDIQEMVETELMRIGAYDVAKCYVRYRYKMSLARDRYKEMMGAVADKLGAKDVQNQNANVDEKSFGGRVGEASSYIMKQFALENCMTEMSRENHLNNEIYIHDLDAYTDGRHNCLTMPIDDLLENGFNTRQADIRPAGSVSTAFQLVAVLFQLQSLQQFGGVSASHIDWTMVPYVRKSFAKHYKNGLLFIEGMPENEIDYEIENMLKNAKDYSIEDSEYEAYSPKAFKYATVMTKKETHQAVEGMYHNLNTLQSRSGNQLPFTSINYGTCSLAEGRMVIEALLNVSIEGLGKLHKTSIFPCGIFQYMKGVNDIPGTPNYDLKRLALKSTAKRLYPNYANVDWSGNAGYDKSDPRTYFSTINKTVA